MTFSSKHLTTKIPEHKGLTEGGRREPTRRSGTASDAAQVKRTGEEGEEILREIFNTKQQLAFMGTTVAWQ